MTSEPDVDDSPTRRWPFGVGQTIVLIVVAVVFAALVGWQVGDRDDPESFNDVDAGFLADMIVHHNGAVALGFEYLPREHDDVVGHFAREIVTTQAGEMAMMNSLVADAGRPDIATDDVAMEWMGMPTTATEMPGLASPADFAELRGATGLGADDVFTRLMIRHHAAGVAMARQAAAEGENPRVRRLARNMARLQRTEIAEMNRRRVELGLAAVDSAAPSGSSSDSSTDAPSGGHDHMH